MIEQTERFLQSKKLVGFGAGLGLLQTVETSPVKLAYVIDGTPDLAGRQVAGFPVYSLDRLAAESDGVAVIIYANTPRAVAAMAAQLSELGYTFRTDYIDSSLLHFQTIGQRLAALGLRPCQDRFNRCRALSLYSNIPNMTPIAGTWLMTELLEHCLTVPGDIAECGVYQGGNAFVVLNTSILARQRAYHLFDSFAGFGPLSDRDPGQRSGDFQDVSFGQVRDAFANFPNVSIHRGFFDETLPKMDEGRYCLVYMDCDLYQPTMTLLEYFWSRISPGGCVLIHDCCQPPISTVPDHVPTA
ncbi:MAG TPA: TylF/MycF/NovP-related O-methyltransferase, partial [Bryobacteraceae bacterium]|nr:TylF/MycF/NovP-related O-methyltransferase [Bryobacteraceae bacterium]